MLRLLSLGLLAALFFSSTFILNRSMSLGGGHWFWSAALRFGWMWLILVGWMTLWRGPLHLARLARLFFDHILFWICAGSIGFGVFYAGICFSASYTPAWVVATTWQATILATPLVLLLFGRRVPSSA